MSRHARFLTTFVALGLAVAAPAEATPPPGENGLIAFASNRDGDYDIYVTSVTGGGATNLTAASAANDTQPEFSPDGTKIAFVSDRSGGDLDIFTMTTGGANQTNLTSGAGGSGADRQPTWFPHGGVIAFTRCGGSCEVGVNSDDIWIMADDGSAEAPFVEGSAADTNPDFYPDGSGLAFASDRGGISQDIYFADSADPSTIVSFDVSSPAVEQSPAFTSAGSALLFESDRDGGDQDIFAGGFAGPGAANLTPDSSDQDQGPVSSPDSQRIAFMSRRDGDYDVYLTTDTGVVNLTADGPTDDLDPSWQRVPDPGSGSSGGGGGGGDGGTGGGGSGGGTGTGGGLTPDGGGTLGLTCDGRAVTLTGSLLDDTLRGTAAADVIAALDGDDSVSGKAQNDRACGAAGNDSLKGGSGRDRLMGEDGRDVLKGGPDRDVCIGGRGRDTFRACEVERG